MSDDSAIEWTDATWNPVRGCTKVSPGCKHCYAETFAERFRGVPGHPYEQGFDLRLVPEKLEDPLRWSRPRRIFVNSMSDLFQESVPRLYVADVFGVMAVAATKFGGKYRQGVGWENQHGPHTFQVLTKRAAEMQAMVSAGAFRGDVASKAYRWAHNRVDAGWLQQCVSGKREWGNHCTLDEMWPLPNVWLGVSVERDDYVSRIDDLRATPAAVRFLSIEPLLGPLPNLDLRGIHWVIVGGESGPGARPMQNEWVRDIRDQCQRAGVAFFFKQWGGVLKKKTGRELDGRTWDEMPSQ